MHAKADENNLICFRLYFFFFGRIGLLKMLLWQSFCFLKYNFVSKYFFFMPRLSNNILLSSMSSPNGQTLHEKLKPCGSASVYQNASGVRTVGRNGQRDKRRRTTHIHTWEKRTHSTNENRFLLDARACSRTST